MSTPPIDHQLLEEIVMSLRRDGNLGPVSMLQRAMEGCSAADILMLHAYLKEYGERFESEWRAEFLSVFPQSAPVLPELDDSEHWPQQLEDVIRSGKLQAVQNFIQRIKVLKMSFDPTEAFSEGKRCGFTEVPKFVPFNVYPLEPSDEESFNPITFSRAEGANEIADYLENVVHQIQKRWKDAYRSGYDADAAKVRFEIRIRSADQALHNGRHVSPEEAVELARKMQASKIVLWAFIKAGVPCVSSYVNAFVLAGMTDYDLMFEHE